MILLILTFVLVLFVGRVLYLLVLTFPYYRRVYRQNNVTVKRSKGDKIKTVVVLGSGGHTTEILLVASKLDSSIYTKHYVIASTDKRSYDKLVETEESQAAYQVHYIPRSREVHQSFFSSVFSTLYSLVAAVPIVFGIRPELVLCNGPGTCVPVCLLAFLLKVLFICDTKIVFIESICRVKTLSLSGKILRYFVDEFLVQWPELKEKYPEVHHLGRL